MRLLHTMLRVGDLQRSIDFYTQVLGMTLLRQSDNPQYRYTLAFVGYGHNPEHAELELTYNWGVDHYELGTAYGHIALAVPDAKAACDSIRAAGGQVTREAGPVQGGSTVIAFVIDPDGYKVELIERRESGRMTSIADLRKSYERAELNEDASHADPLQQFGQWFGEAIASQVPEPNAMTLATVGSNLRPSTRVVLIKDYDEHGIVWYTNYESRKGLELAGNPYAALQFHWVELERVVRIEGLVEKVDAAQSDDYFRTRPLDSRIGAWASPQSQVISGRGVLIANAARYGAQFMLNPPRPPHWGGYRLKPDHWQFWQGRKSRLHDRLRYTLQAATAGHDKQWIRERLAP